MATLQQNTDLALQHHRAGNWMQAEQLYQQILAVSPDDTETWYRLGLLALQTQRPGLGIEHMRNAITQRPTEPAFHSLIGLCLHSQGDFVGAIASFREAIRLNPNWPDAHFHLAETLGRQGDLAGAITELREAVRLKPEWAEAQCNLGIHSARFGKLADAAAAFRQAIRVKPEFAEAHNNLGNVRLTENKFEEAEGRFRKAILYKPDYVEAHFHLAIALTKQGRANEAIESFRAGLALRPEWGEGHNNLGNALLTLGRVREAAAHFAEAMRFEPTRANIISNYLLTQNYDPAIGIEELSRRHREIGVMYAPLAVATVPFTNRRDPERPLRVGYVSPDFRVGPVARFVEPLFAHHSRAAAKVHLYADVPAPDAVTKRLRGMADSWRDTAGMTDDQLAALIRADEIDILVDLSGFTANNRLVVFAKKPAPIQVSYIGYPTTTGVGAIDYRLTDAIVDPVGDERFYSEKLVRLPRGFCCFQPPADAPAPSPSPFERKGFITFGSLHNLPKLNDQVIRLWSDVLKAVPDSRLLLYRDMFKNAESLFREQFLRNGIDASRIEFRSQAPEGGYLAIYGEIDISLDTVPWNGHTTACESLWMGVPILTLTSDRAAGRMVASVLTRVGLDAWIARSGEEYVASAKRFAEHREELVRLRTELRGRISESSLCDGRGFARQVEEAYRKMWRDWCAK